MLESDFAEYLSSAKAALQLFKLSSIEINVYLRLMQLGPRTAGKVSKLCGINRSYTYDVLGSLVRKGLVVEFDRKKLRHFRCADPQQLISALEEHEREMAAQIQKLKHLANVSLDMSQPDILASVR